MTQTTSTHVEVKAEISKKLSKLEYVLDAQGGEIPTVEELINNTVLLGGKRVRPYLCLVYSKFLNVNLNDLMVAAECAELVHAASLAHDDVIDEARYRRGRKTLNERASNAQAILAGDILLARVVKKLVEAGYSAEMIHALSQTLEDLSTGEWLQLEARGRVDVDRQHLEKVGQLKTGSLFRWCCVAPVLFMKKSGQNIEKDEELLHWSCELARLMGQAFQMVDDAIDFSSTSGKDYARDLQEGLVNYVVVTLFEKQPELAKEIRPILGRKSVERYPWSQNQLESAILETRDRAKAKLLLAKDCLDEIEKLLGPHCDLGAKEELQRILQLIEKRKH